MLGHQSHDVRLGNGLSFIYWQGAIRISQASVIGLDKHMTRNLIHHFQNFAIRDVPSGKLIYHHIFSRSSIGIILGVLRKKEDKRDKERNENG